MPGGVLWRSESCIPSNDVVFGENFVIQKPRRGLVKSQRPGKLQPLSGGRESAALMMAGLLHAPGSLVPFAAPGQLDITQYSIVVDTECEEVVENLPTLPHQQSLGIVLYGGRAADPLQEDDTVETGTSSPRRTKKIKYTCNLCGTTSIRSINPYAWTHGSVFGRCGGCNVIHKLTDNLKLFHELSGEVFPTAAAKRRALRIKMPESLPQVPGKLDGNIGLGGNLS